MATTTTSYSQWFNNAVAAVAQEAWQKLMRTTGAAHYLYYKPNGLAFAVFDDNTDPRAEGWMLAMSERIPSDRTAEQLTRLFHDVLAKVPVLPKDA